jgi:hypothetical protein
MTERPTAVRGAEVARLRRGFQGQVLLPDQDGYHQARQVWNAMVDRRPAVITGCTSPADVAAAIGFARTHDLEVGVRCGGHSVLGLSVPEGGLMLDLTPMNSVRVDPVRRRARVAGGALLGDLDRAAQPFGLAATAGNVSHTGVGGLTLGGGMGWLARRLGLACDNVTRFQLVTAEGELLQVSEQDDPDLFWGLRSGGGNFGVVTEFEFRLHPVGTAALLVDLFYAPQDAPRMLRRWRELLPDAPREATLTAWAGTTGQAPWLPPAAWHRPMASVGYVWVGDPDQGRRLLPALRAGATPTAERVQQLSYLELQTMDDQVLATGCCADTGRATTCASSPTTGSRRSCPAATTAAATRCCCPPAACRAMAVRSLRSATTRPRSATGMRWWSSWPWRAGPTRRRTRRGLRRRGAMAPRWSRSPAVSMSTTSPTRARQASGGRTAPPSWRGWRR